MAAMPVPTLSLLQLACRGPRRRGSTPSPRAPTSTSTTAARVAAVAAVLDEVGLDPADELGDPAPHHLVVGGEVLGGPPVEPLLVLLAGVGGIDGLDGLRRTPRRSGGGGCRGRGWRRG